VAFSLPLMNSFNETEAPISPCKICFPRTFSFLRLMKIIYFNTIRFVGWITSYNVCLDRDAPGWILDSLDYFYCKLMKGKALRKHSLHEKTAASVLLKLFISGNK